MLREHVYSSPHEEENTARLREIERLCAFERLVRPEEVASLVKYVADNPVLNGSVLHANLGQVER